jgi:hypothetical protein
VCAILYYKLNQGFGMPMTACEPHGGGLRVPDFGISPYFLRAFGKISKKKQIRACQVGFEPYFRRPALRPASSKQAAPETGKIYRVSSGEKLQRGILVVAPVCPQHNQNHAGNHADHQPARSQGTNHSGRKVEVARSRELSPAPRSLPSGDDPYAQEAELGSP